MFSHELDRDLIEFPASRCLDLVLEFYEVLAKYFGAVEMFTEWVEFWMDSIGLHIGVVEKQSCHTESPCEGSS